MAPSFDSKPGVMYDWHFIGKIKSEDGSIIFKKLVELSKVCSSVSHGNADPERGFSENKHILAGRESLGEETFIAIRLVKESTRLRGGVLKFPITRRLINLFENARTAYEESQAKKKQRKLYKSQQKKIKRKCYSDKSLLVSF